MATREEWLENRRFFLGGSDAAAILGLSPWRSNLDVWMEKTGRIIPADIGEKPQVKYGVEAERHLIELFKLDYPKYLVFTNEDYTTHQHPEHKFITGTLDGSLIEIATGRKGILEIKTGEPQNGAQWEKWKNQIPEYYYPQLLHYFLATGWDFAKLKAQLRFEVESEWKAVTNHYHIERIDITADLDYLLEQELKFWWHVENDKQPGLLLPAI